mgnify:CR=1 FL=1
MIADKFGNEANLTGVDVCQEFINLGYELFDDKERIKCNWMVLPCLPNFNLESLLNMDKR